MKQLKIYICQSNNLCIILMITSHVHELDSTAIIEYNVVIIIKYMHI